MGIQSFFDPFSGHLWVCILVAYVMVSIFMFVIGRVTPYERHAPQDGKGNTLTLANSFWFTLSAFFFRSTTISPKVRHYFFSKSCKHSLFGRLENQRPENLKERLFLSASSSCSRFCIFVFSCCCSLAFFSNFKIVRFLKLSVFQNSQFFKMIIKILTFSK